MKKEIIQDIINLLEQSKDEKEDNFYYHIDNLKEEMEQNPTLFNYKISDLDNVINKMFK